MKTFLAALLPVLLLLALPARVPAQDYTWKTNNDGAITITKYVGTGGAVTIPDTITGLPVSSIGDSAFNSCYRLTNVSIPNSVTNIGSITFGRCTNLTSVTMPNKLTSIGTYAFAYCFSLTNVTPPNSISNLGEGGFFLCANLTSITIPNHANNIGDYMFEGCTSLTGITIADSIASIGNYAFRFCSSLTNVTIPDSVTNIGGAAFLGCTSLTGVTIGAKVASIGDYAFTRCTSLTAVYFLGNAPTAHSEEFNYDPMSTVYYLPGTTNWGATFGGRPVVLWNPSIQTTNTSFGVRTNRFGFNITGTANIPIVVEASTNLAAAAWVPLQTCTLTNGLLYFSDPGWTSHPARLYRIRSP
jgi:hypothetical protein